MLHNTETVNLTNGFTGSRWISDWIDNVKWNQEGHPAETQHNNFMTESELPYLNMTSQENGRWVNMLNRDIINASVNTCSFSVAE